MEFAANTIISPQFCRIAARHFPGSGFGGMPVRPYLYRQCALTCVRLARDTGDRPSKLELLSMAQAWAKLADQAEKNNQWSTKCPSSINQNSQGKLASKPV
jgi:hypothetical protein